jgi:hypothetical protein
MSVQSVRWFGRACLILFWLSVVAIPFFSPLNILFYTNLYFDDRLYLVPIFAAVAAILALAFYLFALKLGQAQVDREVNAWLAGKPIGDRPIILFLRSFETAKSGLLTRALRRVGKAILVLTYLSTPSGTSALAQDFLGSEMTDAAGDSLAEKQTRFVLGGSIYDAEEELDRAIDSRALFVAIGNKRISYGAAKIIVKDEDWQELFRRLTAAARLIFMMPGPTASVLWELAQITSSRDFLEKTVFIMPRNVAAEAWATLTEETQNNLGAGLPRYRRSGCYFHLRSDGHLAKICGLELFTEVLQEYMTDRAGGTSFEVAELWKLIAFTEASKGALSSPPKTVSDWAYRVMATKFVDDAETLIKELGGSVLYEEQGEISRTTRITVKVLGEERNFGSRYEMVQWIIKEIAPRVVVDMTPPDSTDQEREAGTDLVQSARPKEVPRPSHPGAVPDVPRRM